MLLRSSLRSFAAAAALAGLVAYAAIMLRGPQGLAALTQKHNEIETLEVQNANLQRDIDAKKQRIDRLKTDSNTQELEVRKRMKMTKEGETKFVLPDASNSTVPNADAPNPSDNSAQ